MFCWEMAYQVEREKDQNVSDTFYVRALAPFATPSVNAFKAG